MKRRTIAQMIQAKIDIESGRVPPARVTEVHPLPNGKFKRRDLDPNAFKRVQKDAWEKGVAATRQKLGLTQTEFASLLGISARTLQHWEQGTRTPTGAARVLLKLAATHPKAVLKAAA